MPLNRQTDGERLAVAETKIEFLTRGDDELKMAIEAVEQKLEAKIDITNEKLDMVIKRLDAQTNRFEGASKLTIIIMKAWPIVATAVGAILAWETSR